MKTKSSKGHPLRWHFNLRGLLVRIENLLFPPTCVACSRLIPYSASSDLRCLCDECAKRFDDEKRSLCPVCQKKHTDCRCSVPLLKGRVDGVYHLGRYTPYDSVTRRIVLACKDRRDRPLFDRVVNELSLLVDRMPPSRRPIAVTYLPRSRRKAFHSGVDQSKLVAEMLAKRLGFPCIKAFCRHGSKQQKKLSSQDRMKNAISAFSLRKTSVERMRNYTVVLYDDVITTGASMRRAVDLLASVGIRDVRVLTFAKTIRDDRLRTQSSGRSKDVPAGKDVELEDVFYDFDIDAEL